MKIAIKMLLLTLIAGCNDISIIMARRCVELCTSNYQMMDTMIQNKDGDWVCQCKDRPC